MFRAADLMLISKVDLLDYLPEFSPERAETCLRNLATDAPALRLSSRTGIGLDTWIGWLRSELSRYQGLRNEQRTLTPRMQSEGRTLHGFGPEVVFVPVGKAL